MKVNQKYEGERHTQYIMDTQNKSDGRKLLILGNKIAESRDLHWVCEKQTEGVRKNKIKVKGGRKEECHPDRSQLLSWLVL